MKLFNLVPRVATRLSTVEKLEERLALVATPSLVEVPITPAAVQADPALAGYRSFDLKVALSPGDRFLSAGRMSLCPRVSFIVSMIWSRPTMHPGASTPTAGSPPLYR